MQHLVTLQDWSAEQIRSVLDLADHIKRDPAAFHHAMHRKVLLMIFEKPSLRTRLSFEAGMSRMGGHAIFYDTRTSPMAAGKETIEDSIRVSSRFADVIMARLFEHNHLEQMAAFASVPVINALTDFAHPCQTLADLQTIREKKGDLAGLTLAYLGDSNNNVTHSLLFGCTTMGMHVRIGCPPGKENEPKASVVAAAREEAEAHGTSVVITTDASEAVAGADVVYTDSWMSYHIEASQLDERVALFTPYQVNQSRMAEASRDAVFMNCLPAVRGFEQTAEVIDGPQSIVFDQAENRMHAQNAVILELLGRAQRDGECLETSVDDKP